VPTPSGRDGSASAWVGIDGHTCGMILQTGLDITISSGAASYNAWFEWLPDMAHDFSGISFSAGDTVNVTVTALSPHNGIASVENLVTGLIATANFTSSVALCQQDAEWIVEDYEVNGGLVPFVDFGQVVFTSAMAATTTTSGIVGPGSATLVEIEQNNVALTSSSVDDSSVTVTYI